MSLRLITLSPGIAQTRQRVVLDGREFAIVLHWSQREERWYLDLYTATDDLLVAGIKLVPNWPLLYRYRSVAGLPAGELMVVDDRPSPAPPTLDELGDVVQLGYAEAADLEVLKTDGAVASAAGGGGAVG